MGETREERLMQYLEENATPVIGLREGSALRVIGSETWLLGSKTARIFRRSSPPLEVEPDQAIDAWLTRDDAVVP